MKHYDGRTADRGFGLDRISTKPFGEKLLEEATDLLEKDQKSVRS